MKMAVAAALCLAAAAHAQSNKCLTLDGNLDGVRVHPANARLNLAARHTFMAWVRLQEISTQNGILEHIVVKYAAATDQVAYIYAFGPEFTNLVADFGSGARHTSPSVAVTTGAWHHIAFAHDGGTNGAWYLDGALVGQSADASIQRTGTNDLYMGIPVAVGGQNQDFHGEIDEVSLWTNRLSVGEITNYMHRSLTGAEAGLVAYWNFDGGAPTDLTGGGNDGTYVGDAAALAEPAVAQSIGHAVQVNVIGGFPTTVYRLQRATSPTGTWTEVGDSAYGGGPGQSLFDGASETQLYYRVVR